MSGAGIRDIIRLLQWGCILETVFDWVTLAIFAALIVLFLQRSTDSEPRDSIWQYLGASIGCAVANYVGNEGHTIVALLMIGGVLAYIFVALKPLEGWTKL